MTSIGRSARLSGDPRPDASSSTASRPSTASTSTVPQGELRFLIGPNGAGKTTLVDAITGLAQADAAGARSTGQDLLGSEVHKIVRLGIGRTFQTATVFEELTRPAEPGHRGRRPPQGRSACCAPRRRRPDAGRAGAGDDRPDRRWPTGPAGILAHGQKQWLEIGMLLVQDAQLLLLDEPVAGMSTDEREETGELLSASPATAPSSSSSTTWSSCALRRLVTVMHAGKVLAEGTVAEVQADPRVQEVYLGTVHGGEPLRCAEPTMLEIVGVTAGYGRSMVLFDVDLSMPERRRRGRHGPQRRRQDARCCAPRSACSRRAVGHGPARRRGRHQDGAARAGARAASAYVPQGQLASRR